MLTLSSALDAAVSANWTKGVWLVQIASPTTVYRITNWDELITWGGYDWTPAPLEVRGLQKGLGDARNGSLVWTDLDITWWTLALNDELSGAQVDVWRGDADVGDDAAYTFSGLTGGPAHEDGITTVDLINEVTDTGTSPRQRIGPAIGVQYMQPAGSVFTIGGVNYRLQRASN
jgi:hypothetical protein